MRLIDADKLTEHIRQHCGYCGEAIQCVMDAPTIAPQPNPPLTLEELREMDGEPVFVVTSEKSIWHVICSYNEHFTWFSDGWQPLNSDYGTTWLAYRRKPEEALHAD